MRVLVAHNRYRAELPSGENQVVDAEIAALTAAGVDVVTYLRSSDEIPSMPAREKALVPLRPLHSREAVADVDRLIRSQRPDLLHLHNPFPLISWSVVRRAHDRGLPVVVTLHNHRHSCMRGSYFRDGAPCTLSRGATLPWPAVRHGCYRDSRLQSVPMAVAFAAHRADQRSVDRYIALTEAGATSILESGLARPDQVVVRPNTVPDPGPVTAPGRGLLFVGRLTREKGVPLLLDAWERAGRPFGTLTVVGDGPERPAVEAAARAARSGVVATGPLDPALVTDAIAASAAVVVPSTSPEALPLVVLEAFAQGRPVVATDSGGLADAVDDSVGWLAAPSAPDLATVLADAARDGGATRGHAARERYDARYAPDVVLAAQVEIYRSVIDERRSRH